MARLADLSQEAVGVAKILFDITSQIGDMTVGIVDRHIPSTPDSSSLDARRAFPLQHRVKIAERLREVVCALLQPEQLVRREPGPGWRDVSMVTLGAIAIPAPLRL